MWCCRRMEKIKGSEKITNGQVLELIGEKRTLLKIYYVKKPIGSTLFKEERGFFMMLL